MADQQVCTKHQPTSEGKWAEYIASECQETRIGLICKMKTSCIMFPAVKITQVNPSEEVNSNVEQERKLNQLDKSAGPGSESHEEGKSTSKYTKGHSELVLYSCEKCSGSVVVSSLTELKKHIYSVHLSTDSNKIIQANKELISITHKEYICKKCDGKFSQKYLFDLHIKYTHKPELLKCSQCGQLFQDESSQNIHKCTHVADEQFTCDVCEKRFKWKFNLDRHQVVHTKARPYSCKICGKTYTDFSGLAYHKSRDHKDEKRKNSTNIENTEEKIKLLKSNQSHTCEKCGGKFSQKYKLDLHVKYAHILELIKCKQCGELLQNERSQKIHRCTNTNNAQFTCNFCDKRFKWKHNLKRHQVVHTKARPYHCQICGKTYSDFSGLAYHKSKCHNEGRKRNNHIIESSEEGNHQIIEGSEERNNSIIESSEQRSNQIIEGSEERNKLAVESSEGRKNIQTIESRDEIIKNVINSIRSHTCEKCGGKFSQKYKLDMHVKYAHKHELIKCKQCGQLFQNIHSQNIHRCTNTSDEQFTCGFCDKRFKWKHNLKRHQVVHTKARPYSCNICGKTYSDFSGLAYHKSKCHTEGRDANNKIIESSEENSNCKEDLIPIERENVDKTLANNEERIKALSDMPKLTENVKLSGHSECIGLGTNFSSKTSFKSRVNSQTKRRPFPCDFCKKAFFEIEDLIAHEKADHIEETEECTSADVLDTVQEVEEQQMVGYRISKSKNKEKEEKLLNTLNTIMQNFKSVGPFDCPICGRPFLFRYKLKRHLVIHIGLRPYSCEFCSKEFYQIGELNRHKKVLHFAETKRKKFELYNSQGKKLYSCDACGKTFHSESVMKCHYEAYHEQCDSRDKTFHDECIQDQSEVLVSSTASESRTEIKQEIDIISSEECNTEDAVSGTKYTTSDNSGTVSNRSFIEIKHTNEVTYNMSGKKNSRVSNLKQHEKSHDVLRFSCHVCKKSFHYNYELKRHLAVHSDDLPFACEICGHRVRNSSKMQYHMRTHTKVRPYTCSICSRSFSFKHNLKRHMCVHSCKMDDPIMKETDGSVGADESDCIALECQETRIGILYKMGSSCTLFPVVKVDLNITNEDSNNPILKYIFSEGKSKSSDNCRTEDPKKLKSCNKSSKKNHVYLCEICNNMVIIPTMEELRVHISSIHLSTNITSQTVSANNKNSERTSKNNKIGQSNSKQNSSKDAKQIVSKHNEDGHNIPKDAVWSILKHNAGSHSIPKDAVRSISKHNVDGIITLKDANMSVLENSVTYKCNQCGRKFLKLLSLDLHKKHFHTENEIHKCYICGKTFHNNYSLRGHKKKHVNMKRKLTDAVLLSSSLTEMEITKMYELRKRESYEEGKVTCHRCDKEFHFEALQSHLQTCDEKRFKCNTCNEYLHDEFSLKIHLVNNPTHNSSQYQYACVCEEVFEHNEKLLQHIKTSVHCKTCGMMFENEKLLKTHMDSHNGKEYFPCKKCDKTFVLKSSLEHHQQSKHELSTCSVCHKTFSSSINLVRHEKTHSLVETVVCKICGKKFSYISAYKGHLRLHGINPFSCDVCYQSFPYSTNLKTHKKSHTLECEICDRTFSFISALKRHVKICHGMKPFKCELCPESFHLSSTLSKHIEKNHL